MSHYITENNDLRDKLRISEKQLNDARDNIVLLSRKLNEADQGLQVTIFSFRKFKGIFSFRNLFK